MDSINYKLPNVSRQGSQFKTKLNIVVTVLLYVLTTVFMCAFIILLVLRTDNAASIIRHTDFTAVLEEAGIAEHSYYIANQLNGLYFHDTEVSVSDIEEFIKSPAVSDEIGGVLDDYARAFASGNLNFHLTADDIAGIAKSLEPEFNVLLDHHMTDEHFEHLARTIDDIIDLSELSVGNIINELGIDTTIPYLLLSSYLLIGTGLLCVILLALIFLQRRSDIAGAFLVIGIPIALSGLICFILGLWFGSLSVSPESSFHTAAVFLSGPAHVASEYGFAFAAVGVIVVVVSYAIGHAGKARTDTDN